MSKFILAESGRKCLYVYDTCTIKDEDDYILHPRELKLEENEENLDRIYHEHFLIDRDHLLVQWDIYSDHGDEWHYNEQNQFDATIFSLNTYQPLVTATVALNRGFIIHHEIIYGSYLCLFTVEGWGSTATIRLWDWQHVSDSDSNGEEMLARPIRTYEEWLALIDELKLVSTNDDKRVNILISKHFDDYNNCQYSKDFAWEHGCIGGDQAWSQPGWKDQDVWKFGCFRETDKMLHSNQDIPSLRECNKHIKYHALKTEDLGEQTIHNLAILVAGKDHLNYQILSFPCSESKSKDKALVLYKKDLSSSNTIPAENFLVLSHDHLIVIAQEYLLLTDIYLNFQYELSLPKIKNYLFFQLKYSMLPYSSLDMEKIQYLIDEVLIDTTVMPVELISIIVQYL